MKKKLIIVISIIIVVLIAGGTITYFVKNSVQVPQSEYEVPFDFDDGFVPKIKVPDDTVYIGDFGLFSMKFETSLSHDEVKEFYDDYFSTLQIVYSKGHMSNETVYYYDKNQRVIFYNLTFWDDNDGKTQFLIWCESCADINNNDYWTAKNPE